MKDSLDSFRGNEGSLFLAMGESIDVKRLYIFNLSDSALEVSLKSDNGNVFRTSASGIARVAMKDAQKHVEALKAKTNHDKVVGFVMDSSLLSEVKDKECIRFTFTRRSLKSGKVLAISFEFNETTPRYWIVPEENLCPFNCDNN